jgi:hypothetical protein
MALESGTYIDSLNVSNPAATDALAQADDHLRLLKSTIKSTFPNVAGAITGTHTAINAKVAEPVAAITSDGTSPSLTAGISAASVKTLIEAADAAITTDGSTPSLASGIEATEVLALLGAAPSATTTTLLNVYPVGCVYTSVVATSPQTFFGGTWVAFGSGKVLVGVDANDTDFDTVEEAGGSKTHTLTIAEMPAHTHTFTSEDSQGTGASGSANGVSEFDTAATTGSTGTGQAHPILQPYIVVHMWKRTA